MKVSIILPLLLTTACVVASCTQSSTAEQNVNSAALRTAPEKPNFGDANAGPPPALPAMAQRDSDGSSGAVADPQLPKASDMSQDTTRLEALYRSRTTGITVADYPIGPGDVVSISVPPIDELRERTVRVEADGSISLPMLGSLQAGGLTEKQLRAELSDRLKAYMYKPEVDVFVKEYRSRQVAVVGMVNNPGLVTLTGPNETVLDMLTRSGGLTATAADEIILMPAEQSKQEVIGRIAQVSAQGSDPAAALRPAESLRGGARSSGTDAGREAAFKQRELGALLRQNAHPLMITLKSTALTGGGTYLNMPVRPGDVIVVPGGGDVMVIGWVQNPGHFQVGSGLTVLGAIGAAGGPMYAAKESDVHLIRTRRDGSKLLMKIDLNKIKSGEESDLPVRGNDVIDVPYSDLKVGPYVFYQMLSKMAIGGPAVPTP